MPSTPDALEIAVREFVNSIRLSDLLDLALASVFLFIMIGWARRTISRRVLMTALVVAAAFVLTRLLDLDLTEMLIEVLAVVLLIIAAVVFQNDIRRMIEQVGWPGWPIWSGGRSGRRRAPEIPPVLDVMADAVGRLAQHRMGALIAIRGRESWDRHIKGGVELDGRLSESLLQSLFHPQTPGHDGALLMEGERVARFAAHLPLSADVRGIEGGGTRHAAALGLSEHCDALVIVVSEERGTIGVAQEGELTTLDSPDELRERLAAFWRRHYVVRQPPERVNWWRSPGLQSAVVSVLLAVSMWLLLVHETQLVYRTFVAPVELRNMPAELELENPVPTDIRITLAGREQTLRQLHSQNLAISLDLERLEPGANEITITQENLELAGELGTPERLHLYRAQPPTLEIRAERLQSVRVPVVPRMLGAGPEGLRLVTEPREVTLLVSGGADPPRHVLTEPINLRGIEGPTEIRSRLQLPDEARLAPDQSAEVVVRLVEDDESGS